MPNADLSAGDIGVEALHPMHQAMLHQKSQGSVHRDRSQSPVHPVNGAARPSARYIFPTSDGITNHVTGEITM